jgi:hypothetical protein
MSTPSGSARFASSLFGCPESPRQKRSVTLIKPSERSTHFHFKPSISEMRIPVETAVSELHFFGNCGQEQAEVMVRQNPTFSFRLFPTEFRSPHRVLPFHITPILGFGKKRGHHGLQPFPRPPRQPFGVFEVQELLDVRRADVA